VHIKQICPIKGESVSASIAAASIVAKVTRDRLMQQYHEIYPEYGFEKHKGYGTKEHMEKLLSYGPCPIHRKSFDKVMDLPLPFK
jgi:ribonuclease HII